MRRSMISLLFVSAFAALLPRAASSQDILLTEAAPVQRTKNYCLVTLANEHTYLQSLQDRETFDMTEPKQAVSLYQIDRTAKYCAEVKAPTPRFDVPGILAIFPHTDGSCFVNLGNKKAIEVLPGQDTLFYIDSTKRGQTQSSPERIAAPPREALMARAACEAARQISP